ncbi:MAG: penicillin acylase family protein [Gammaproteobacteria bacterium]|nr:penicillin acylase family protein [Gammaproteobacteria bacterium]
MKSGYMRAAACALALVLSACGSSDLPQPALKAKSVLPPGNSGLVTADGQAKGLATADSGAYGANVDDQRLLYWSFGYKDGAFQKTGAPLRPKDGVEVYFDAYGVPAIYAPELADLWYGAGYVAAQQRLFLMDAVRRTARGTLAELTGCGAVPADLQTRVLSYTDEEYQAFYDRLSADSKAAVDGYVAGANAWIDELPVSPGLMPAEYELLSSQPEPFDALDIMATGVLMTRTVASEGGNEFLNIRMLKALQQKLGAEAGRAAFLDLVWDEDRKAVTTVPGDREFPNQPGTAQSREAAFEARADWALTLPETVWKGDGTGHAAKPCSPQDSAPVGAALPGAAAKAAGRIQDFPKTLHGGSFAVAIAGSRTRDGGALLISAPQLGYTYPTLLYEFEIHSGDYHARGVSVPGLPVVGIGYTPHLAWALTTGYSKTIDSFVERVCSTAEQSAGTCAANRYFHDGQWKDMACRTETVRYRRAQSGAPFGPADLSRDYEVCRTVHGPVVARDDAAGLARSVGYAMWGREIDNMEGIREWGRARDLDAFRAATSGLTWNENVTVATRGGDIAFFHPGLYPVRPAGGDQRLPLPGTGEFDFAGFLPFERMPQSANPAQGFLANWNNKPALGWLEGEGIGPTSRPGGPGQRVTSLLDQLGARSDWTYADLETIDRVAGTRDPRARQYLPAMLRFRSEAGAGLTDTQKAALALLAKWDRAHYGPGIDAEDDEATDGPAATIFGYWVDALREELFGFTGDLVIDEGDPADPADDMTVFNRQAGVGSHKFDQSVMDNLIVRILDPQSSSLPVRHDWAEGRSRNEILRNALIRALGRLSADFNDGVLLTPDDLDKCRRIHPRSEICSLTGVIGPGSETTEGDCVTMPYQDRGSWVHLVGYEGR